MVVVSLQFKMKIDKHSENENYQELFKVAQELIDNFPSRIIRSDKAKTWSLFKNRYKEQYIETSSAITQMAKHYLNSYEHIMYDISGRYQIQLDWNDLEAEISYTEIDKLDATVISVYFHSKEYCLLEKFGNQLLLRENFDTISEKQKLLTIELSDTVTIHTYTN